MYYLSKLNMMHDVNKDRIVFLLILFCTLSSGFYIFSFDYSMDDAWIKSDNYLKEFSFDGIIDNFMYAYHLLWNKQGRFGGVVPIIRAIDGAITQSVLFHYALNVIFHSVNACLMYSLCFNRLRIGRKLAIVTACSFAILIPLRGPLYAVGLYVGSIYVNILTLILLMVLTAEKTNRTRTFVFSIYFILAIGNYSLIVLVPALLMYFLSESYSWKRILKLTFYLLLPIFINIFIVLFSPPTKYEGTKPKLDIIHLYSNFQDIISRLLPFDFMINISIIFVMLIISTYYIIKFNKYSFQILFSLGLMFGYLSIFSISSRNSFPNPYFLYIPYFGFILTLGLLFHKVKNGWLVNILCVIILFVGYYKESTPYVNFRLDQSNRMQKLKTTIENAHDNAANAGINNSLIIISLNEESINGLHLGYFDKVVSSWQKSDDSNCYILSTDYVGSGPDTKFKTGFSQYTDVNISYRNVSDIISFYSDGVCKGYIKLSPNNVYVFDSSNNEMKNIVNLEPMMRMMIISPYGMERNGDYSFTWTKKAISINIEQDYNFNDSILYISGKLFSIIDNDISVFYGEDNIGTIHIDRNKVTPFSLTIPINGSMKINEILISFSANSSTQVPGDSRELAFYIDNAIDIVFSDEDKNKVPE